MRANQACSLGTEVVPTEERILLHLRLGAVRAGRRGTGSRGKGAHASAPQGGVDKGVGR